MNCPNCTRESDTPITGICPGCQGRLLVHLTEIVEMAAMAQQLLAPRRSGEATAATYGSRPPIDLACSDYADRLGFTEHGTFADGSHYSTDRNGLDALHGWERVIREERDLTPPALIPYAGSPFAEIVQVCTFLTTHADWACAQPWADELAREVAAIHWAGLVVLRATPQRRGRIACPGDDPETGDVCGETIWMPGDFADYVTQPGDHAPKRTLWCSNCTTTWTFERLLRVAIAVDPGAVVRGFGKDFIEHHLGISRRHVNRMLADATRAS